MSKLLTVLWQFVINTLLITDKLLNTILAGDPAETLSRRIARAREAGERWAVVVCSVLTFAFNVLGFIHRLPKRDHCTYALQPGSIGREVWSWSPVAGAQKTVTYPVKLGSNPPPR